MTQLLTAVAAIVLVYILIRLRKRQQLGVIYDYVIITLSFVALFLVLLLL